MNTTYIFGVLALLLIIIIIIAHMSSNKNNRIKHTKYCIIGANIEGLTLLRKLENKVPKHKYICLDHRPGLQKYDRDSIKQYFENFTRDNSFQNDYIPPYIIGKKKTIDEYNKGFKNLNIAEHNIEGSDRYVSIINGSSYQSELYNQLNSKDNVQFNSKIQTITQDHNGVFQIRYKMTTNNRDYTYRHLTDKIIICDQSITASLPARQIFGNKWLMNNYKRVISQNFYFETSIPINVSYLMPIRDNLYLIGLDYYSTYIVEPQQNTENNTYVIVKERYVLKGDAVFPNVKGAYICSTELLGSFEHVLDAIKNIVS